MSIPAVGITIGNPAGIGPEIVVRALVATASIREEALWRAGYRHLGNTES